MVKNARLILTSFLLYVVIIWDLVLDQRKYNTKKYLFYFELKCEWVLFRGPSSVNPISKSRYGSTFPIITLYDMVKAQFILLDHLGIEKVRHSLNKICY